MHLEPAGDSYFDTTYDFGVVTATSIPRMTLGSCLSRTVQRLQPTRFALVCVRVFSVYQVHGQVWSSCQTERLGVQGAGDARTSVDCDAVLILLPRSASRLARGWSRGRGRGPGRAHGPAGRYVRR